MVQPYPVYPVPVSLNEYIYPDADSLVAVWTTQTGSTSNLYTVVDDISTDTDYIKLNNSNLILSVCPSTTSKTARFRLGNPSGPVNPYQTVQVAIRSRIYDPFSTGFTATVDVKLKEGTTTIIANDTGNVVTGTFGTDFLIPTNEQKTTITDWDNLYIEGTWNVCASGLDADLNIYCSAMYVRFL